MNILLGWGQGGVNPLLSTYSFFFLPMQDFKKTGKTATCSWGNAWLSGVTHERLYGIPAGPRINPAKFCDKV
jgi:hypothetical protein